MISKKLAHYEVVEKIGAGGMGEVYRAHDTKLARDVALKLLPAEVASDTERLARFDREAKLLASLNHPHIASIYGIEQSNSQRFLVLELVEGEDLSERIARGAVPLEETLSICRQIAEALEAAHEQGVIHRDLKPANVKLTADGNVKVLDFGLAKALEVEEASPNLSHSPTLTTGATVQGMILGTAGYMSPEQARGKTADKRSDIWAFGCVLYEMLTGRQTFAGDTVSDTLASVLARDPDLDVLPSNLPGPIARLLRRCLEKDDKRRLRDIGEARITIEGVLSGEIKDTVAEPTMAAAPARTRPWVWAITGLVAVCAVAGWFMFFRAASQSPPVYRVLVPPPQQGNFEFAPGHPGPPRISPDGTRIVYAARQTGLLQLWVQSLDEPEPRPLSGTDNAGYPFWSPDGRTIGFFANGKLKRVDAVGGPPLTVSDAVNGKGGSWNEAGDIIFAPAHNTGIHRVKATGGESVAITKLDVAGGENSHRHPRFLPDGEHYLYFVRTTGGDNPTMVWVASLDGSENHRLVPAESFAAYSSDHLFYLREQVLLGQTFDAGTRELTGDPFPVVEGVYYIQGAAAGVFDVADNGVMVYHLGGQSQDEIVWLDRSGNILERIGDLGTYSGFSLSPDNKYIACEVYDARSNSDDLWVIDVETGVRTRFTYDPENDWSPVWSPDSRRIMFDSRSGGQHDLYEKSIVGSEPERLILETDQDKYVADWSGDGKHIAYVVQDSTGAGDIWILSLSGDREPFKFNATPAGEQTPKFSPDSKWLAYRSDETGTFHIYVSPFPGGGRKWQVSSEGGFYARWRSDGKEIYYASTLGQIIAVDVDQRNSTFIIGAEEALFASASGDIDPSPDGQRFVTVRSVDDQTADPMALVINWFDAFSDQR